MAYLKIWIHIVWTTKNREPYLTKEFRPILFEHIKKYAENKDIYIIAINGYHDHVHCLIRLGPEISISKIVGLLKGESSFWINKNKLLNYTFEWQDEYWAVSLHPRDVKRVREYINNQELHHKKITFTEEYNEFIKEFKLD